jgi:NitT/TauT family transport system substrate-binding protein
VTPRCMARLAVAAAVVAVSVAGCSSAAAVHPHHAVKLPVGPPGTSASGSLRLGFGEDVVDAPALVGLQMGYFQRDLGRASLEAAPFTSPASLMTALANGQLDAAYVDPVSAVMASEQARGMLRIVAGAACGGSELVVQKEFGHPRQLKGHALAAPPGGVLQATADAWLRANKLPPLTANEAAASTDAGVMHQFRAGLIAGAWEPAPLDAEMVAAGGRLMMAASGPAGEPRPTLVLVVTSKYLTANPAAIAALLDGQLQADQYLAADRTAAEDAFRQKLISLQGEALPQSVLSESFDHVTFTADPFANMIQEEIQQAAAADLVSSDAKVQAMFDLGALNSLLRRAGRKAIAK